MAPGAQGDTAPCPAPHKGGHPPCPTAKSARSATCDTILGTHDQLWACRACNSRKGTMGLYTFFRLLYPNDRKFYDRIPPLVEKRYLKTVHDCLACLGCHDAGDLDGDGELTVLDIDFALSRCT